MFLSVSNYIFTVIFVGEMMIKVTITRHERALYSKLHFSSYLKKGNFLPGCASESLLNQLYSSYCSIHSVILLGMYVCVCVCVCQGGCFGPVLWKGCVPAEQLEYFRWNSGVCVHGGHPGLPRLIGWKSNLRNPACASSAPHIAATQVGVQCFFLCLL